MDLMNLTKLQEKRKKPTELKIKIECESRRQANNIKLCILELLYEDMNFPRRKVKFQMEDKSGV